MLKVRPMLGRDPELLADLFPEKGIEQFQTYYLEHLQERRMVLVAGNQEEDHTWQLTGYGCILWESPYTHFWRRRIPEIVDLNVAETFRKQGYASAIIAMCEQICHDRHYTQIGISVEQSDHYADANRLYPKLDYVPDGFGITTHDHELHLVKTLKQSTPK